MQDFALTVRYSFEALQRLSLYFKEPSNYPRIHYLKADQLREAP